MIVDPAGAFLTAVCTGRPEPWIPFMRRPARGPQSLIVHHSSLLVHRYLKAFSDNPGPLSFSLSKYAGTGRPSNLSTYMRAIY